MAFSFGNSNMGSPASGAGGNVQAGPDLEDIQTEGLGFLALSGEAKVQLLSTPWPSNQLPPPSASLMSVASKKGLVAAAGPDAIILATTKSVREAFEGKETGDNNLKPFQPQLRLPMPMRISQLAFSADEQYLVLSAETGGGLAVYDVQALMSGSTQSAFELSTNGQSLRALTPNPTPEKGELFAVVTVDGNLLMANLKERNFIQGPNGQILKDGVSCVSWSAKGKQLVAGLGNGTAYQVTPDGVGKGDIPRPPNVNNGDHVSSITWLENNVFLVVHTPSGFDGGMAPTSSIHLVTRQPPSSFMFQKISDPAGPFGMNRSPPHHFLLRLRDFPPNLQDVLIVASTASTDVGIFSRSKTPLTADKPADKVTGVFTMTEMSDDSRRAQLPMTSDLSDTSPIGLALDLSSTEKVTKPIPSDEMDESPTPLPALMVLNNEGVLASWWIVYSESIRQGTIYPGLVAAEGTAPTQAAPAPAQQSSPFGAPKPAFGSSAFGTPSTGSAFGSSQPASAFGKPSLPGPSTGAFGAPSGLGTNKSPWGTPAASSAPSTGGATFGAPAFGSSTALGSASPFGKPAFGSTSTPAFGGAGLPGNRSSPWATESTAPSSTFGQASGLAKSSAFGTPPVNTGSAIPTSGGFSSFASKGGFAAAASAQNTTGSIFSKPAPPSFGASTGASSGGIFGSSDQTSTQPGTSVFGSTKFNLGSTFKADPSAKDEGPATDEPKTSFFGGTFGSALGEAAKQPAAETPISKDADMDTMDETAKPEEPVKDTTTPATTPAPSKFQPFSATTPTSTGGLFGTVASQPSLTAAKPAVSAGFNFGKPLPESNVEDKKEAETAIPSPPIATEPTPVSTEPVAPASSPPTVKQEPEVDETDGVSGEIPEAPLPPEPTNIITTAKTQDTQPAGPLSPKSPAGEPAPKAIPADMIPPSDVPGGPEEESDRSGFYTDDDYQREQSEEASYEASEEGSGEDVAQDLSPISDANQTTPGFTPQHSFGGLNNRDAESGLFTKISRPSQPATGRTLFGEIGTSAPSLPPPKAPESPRSPSPVRSALPPRMARPDGSRSVSAPGVASQLLGPQRLGGRPTSPPKTSFALTLEQQRAEEARRAQARARKEAEEAQALVDEEDEQMQKYLAEEIVPTRTLDEFVAHTDYVGGASMDSIPAQVEAVYRDINSMIDTLGVNARALKAFIQGHTEQYKEEGRTKEDLENEEDWCLVEIEELSSLVENDLTRELEDGRIKDVASKLETCNDLQKDLIKLRAKHEDIKKLIQAHQDPEQVAMSRAQPLSAEQSAQQSELRREFTKFQKLLSEAEEGLTVLKGSIVSQATSSGKANGSTGPTVEAVMKTIAKMTGMAEKRSGDIDVLEGQMRKLGLHTAAGAGSREGSPFSTPQPHRQSFRQSMNPGTYGLAYSPETTRTARNLQSSFRSSIGSVGPSSPSPRKKMSGYSAEEKTQLRTKLARRTEVLGRLKGALEKAGTNVKLMDDDE